MARIRSIKPDFFRHEQLQEVEAKHPGQYVMLVFAGLWTQCDRRGRFAWRPRQLKLDILPFLNFDLAATLSILAEHGFVQRYTVDGEDYGSIPTFEDHQRISGQEAQSDGKYPGPTRKQQGSTREHPKCPGNGVRSTDIGKGNGGAIAPAPDALIELPEGVPADLWAEWEQDRRARGKPLSSRAIAKQFKFLAEQPVADRAEIIRTAIRNDWQGFWPLKGDKHRGKNQQGAYQRILEANGVLEGSAKRLK